MAGDLEVRLFRPVEDGLGLDDLEPGAFQEVADSILVEITFFEDILQG